MRMHSRVSPAVAAAQPRRIALWLALPLAALALVAAGKAHAQAYVNINVGGAIAPGVYGQIAIGNLPPPPVLNPQPVVVGPVVPGMAPVYVYVPPHEQREWARYCARYRACGAPVHFVRVDPRDRWWERHDHHLRGPGYYRQPEPHREHRGERHDRRDERGDRR